MTPAERIEQRAKELYEYLGEGVEVFYPWDQCPSQDRWRRLARLTFRYERDAAYIHAGAESKGTEVDAEYANLLPENGR